MWIKYNADENTTVLSAEKHLVFARQVKTTVSHITDKKQMANVSEETWEEQTVL